jgi:hypothetical protein
MSLINKGKLFSRLRQLRMALLGIAAAAITACGAGGSAVAPQSNACSDCGTALLTMTDAQGDFLRYSVDVTSLMLKTANGTLVQTLPATSRIDFAQLVDLVEVLSAAQVPTADYVAATLGVDFTNADIVVDDGTEMGAQVSPVDADGNPLGYIELTVQLDNRHHLRIRRKSVSHLAFDLNLAASNVVDLATHTVAVSPIIVASVQPVEPRQVRARGRLDSVDVAGSTYTIDVRPFHEDSESAGQMVIHTTSFTSFEINGMVSTGADGLTALASLTDHPVTIAFGSIDSNDGSFTAQRVLAASSAQDLRRDYLSGNVLSRSGNMLTVVGTSFEHRDHDQIGHDYHDRFERGPVMVTVGPDTLVTRDGQASGTLDIGAISVGQRIEVFGDLTRDGEGHASIDATAGRVRLNYTHLLGRVTANLGGALTLDLQSIDGRDPAHFDFTGTGLSPTMDADPDQYEVDTGLLNVSSLGLDQYTRLFGFVTPFGMASPDFHADTFMDFTNTRAALVIGWGLDGETAPFLPVASPMAGYTVDLTRELRGAIRLGGPVIDVATLPGLRVEPATSGYMAFAIGHRHSHKVENFSSFADFSAALDAELDGMTPVQSLIASGTFDSPGGVFTTGRMLVVLGD